MEVRSVIPLVSNRDCRLLSVVFWVFVCVFMCQCSVLSARHSKPKVASVTSKKLSTKKSLSKNTSATGAMRTKKKGASSGLRKSHSSSKASRRAQRALDMARARAESRMPRALAEINIAKDSIVSDGIIYRQIHVTHADSSHTLVHALTCVLRNPSYGVMTLKAENQSSSLEKLKSFCTRLDSTENKTIYAAVNANFWRAGTTTAIGPTVCSGEVCEMLPYKDWGSCFFDLKNRPLIDTFSMTATLRKSRGPAQRVQSVNRRISSDSIVVYNSFIGQTVPYVATSQIEQELDEIMSDTTVFVRDSSDLKFSRDSLRVLLIQQRQESASEFANPKMQLRYLRSPAVNQDVPMLVLKTVDSGSVSMPLRGCVISMGNNVARSLALHVGDTVYLRYTTSKRDTVVFTNAVCGTPLLVANGAILDNLKPTNGGSQRFYYRRLARTAIGTDITRNTVYLVTVESNARSRGFSIAELAEFMKRFGAYSALNLDGGGSAQMLIGDSIVSHTPDQGTRRISVALALGKRKARLLKKTNDAKKEN